MSDVAFVCRDVVAGYGDVEVLHGVSIEVRSGTITALLGNNGAGKTTLFSVIAGNLRANDGSISFDGRRIDGLRPDQISQRGVARTFQIVRPFGNMTVLENVMLGVVFLVLLQELLWTNLPQLYMIVVGALLIAVVVWLPGGIYGRIQRMTTAAAR